MEKESDEIKLQREISSNNLAHISKDLERGSNEISSDEDDSKTHLSYWQKFKIRFPYYKLVIHIFWGCFFTSWWLSIIIQKKHRHKWLIPTVFWGMMMVRLITFHTRILYYILDKARIVWNYAVDLIYGKIPNRNHRLILGASVVVAVILLGTFIPSETEYSKREDRAIAFCGLIITIAVLYITSNDRSKIEWRTVINGTLIQFIIGLFVLRTKAGYDIFNFISTLARELLGFAKDGVAFLTNTSVSQLGMFFFTVLPAVSFFVAVAHILYYFGIMQWVIRKVAVFFFWALKVTGAEAITAAGSPFLGIGESAVLVKDFMPYLTDAEIHQVMCSGFSTISGSVLVGYVGIGVNPQAMVSSCVMSIPASLAISKLRYPETEHSITKEKVEVNELEEEGEDKPVNVLQAFSNGAGLGLKIALLMMIQCMCIIALVALINGILTWFGNFWNIKNLTLEKMSSYILYPVTFLLGTPRKEILHVSKLLATRIIQNEYNAYTLLLNDSPYTEMSKRGKLIATYALCGFSNFGSMGIQIGVLGTLAPKKVKNIAKVIVSSLISGCIATLTSTMVAGMILHDLDDYNF